MYFIETYQKKKEISFCGCPSVLKREQMMVLTIECTTAIFSTRISRGSLGIDYYL